MHRFETVLFNDGGTPEQKMRSLVAAAEACLPHEVLHPAPGSTTEVDLLTGRAIEEIWREAAEIYGGDDALEMSDPEKNPLCRGMFVFTGTTPAAGGQVWDNTDGDALIAWSSSPAIALAAARMAAADRDILIEQAVEELEENAAVEIEARFAAAVVDSIARTRNEILEAAGSEAIEIETLRSSVDRLAELEKLSNMMEDGEMPIDGDLILEHADADLETIMSPDYLARLAMELADGAARNRSADASALREMASDAGFWAEAACRSPEHADESHDPNGRGPHGEPAAADEPAPEL